jgi:hypothetical protein
MAFEEGNVKKSGSSPEGCIRFHTAAGAGIRLYTVTYGRCAGRSFITGPLRGEGDFYEEIHVDYC